MQQFGQKERFATIVGASANGLRHVEIWAGERSLTPVDQRAYVPAFSHAVRGTIDKLQAPNAIVRHGALFVGRGVSSSFKWLATQAHPTAWRDLGVFHWGPTTDDILCFLLPIDGQIYLAWKERGHAKTHRIPVQISDVVAVLERTLAELKPSDSGNKTSDA